MVDKQDRLKINKRNAMAFYDLMFNLGKPAEAMALYGGDVYIQHNADYAGIDIFRLDGDGRIVEHWDVLQTVPDKLPHNNGMF